MSLRIQTIESRPEWENFILKAKPQTFLHSWSWGEFNEKMGTKIFRFGLYDQENLVGVVLILKIAARRGAFLFCPHGPVFLQDINKSEALKLLLDHLKIVAAEERCAFIRFSPLMENNLENEELFLKNGFRQAPIHMQHPELAWILDVSAPENDLMMNMRKTTRYCIRKAQKDGVEVFTSDNPDDVEKFWEVYQTTVDRQNFTPFSKTYLKTEMEVFGKNNEALFFFAKYNNELVATALIVFYNGSAFYHHGASTHKYSKITAPYLLQWHIILEAKKRGFKLYDFWGVSPEDNSKHPWAGLSLFKRGFGGAEHAYVHAKDYVISSKYWLSFVVETVRRKKRHL